MNCYAKQLKIENFQTVASDLVQAPDQGHGM